MAEDHGASPRELLMEACRRNNTSLLEEVLADLSAAGGEKATEHVAKTLNEARDGIGNGVLHLAASNGSYEVLDILLDQEGLEIDEPDRMEKDTPLHKAVRFVNSLSKDEWEQGHHIVDILVDAGCDPRIRNKAKLRPFDLVDPRNLDLRKMLQKAEFAMMAGADVVQEDDDGPTGSGSDSN
ncbi:putative ankyrin repeat protein [Neofusicoccum parvum UCRNP2]|uniref:Putative ankyrin repeat protein n=1 Tax=Botryosphaeria parva (strain UCR-NP2) TaxID=1287680 RepID=R1EYP3_BOTPV|nr:putative ankyrin repeat protein [Neofusicoccum parvum UCRNP2]